MVKHRNTYRNENGVEVEICAKAECRSVEDQAAALAFTAQSSRRFYLELERKMGEIIRKYGLTRDAAAQMERSIGVNRVEIKGNRFTVVNNDCVEETSRMAENSIDLIHTSKGSVK